MYAGKMTAEKMLQKNANEEGSAFAQALTEEDEIDDDGYTSKTKKVDEIEIDTSTKTALQLFKRSARRRHFNIIWRNYSG